MNCPLPRYYFCHAAVALLIAAALWWPLGLIAWAVPSVAGLVAGLAAGVGFYAGREHAQWEQGDGPGLPFDWKGIVAPFVASLIALSVGVLLLG